MKVYTQYLQLADEKILKILVDKKKKWKSEEQRKIKRKNEFLWRNKAMETKTKQTKQTNKQTKKEKKRQKKKKK